MHGDELLLGNSDYIGKLGKMTKFMFTPNYELAMNLLLIANLMSLELRNFGSTQSVLTVYIWVGVQVVLNLFHFTEFFVDLLVGESIIKSFKNNFRMWPEAIC